ELAFANVDRVHARGSMLEQRGGEPSRARPDIDGNAVAHRDAELVESMRELDLAAKPTHRQHPKGCVESDAGVRIGEHSSVNEDATLRYHIDVYVGSAATEQIFERDKARSTGLGHGETSRTRTNGDR